MRREEFNECVEIQGLQRFIAAPILKSVPRLRAVQDENSAVGILEVVGIIKDHQRPCDPGGRSLCRSRQGERYTEKCHHDFQHAHEAYKDADGFVKSRRIPKCGRRDVPVDNRQSADVRLKQYLDRLQDGTVRRNRYYGRCHHLFNIHCAAPFRPSGVKREYVGSIHSASA